MKKLAAVLLAAAMALTLLTACGGGGGGGSTSGGDSMETVFNFTGEELTAELNKELSSNAVYDEVPWRPICSSNECRYGRRKPV